MSCLDTAGGVKMKRETVKAVGWATLVAGLTALLVIVGSRNLTRFDASLVAYTFATLFAIGGITGTRRSLSAHQQS
jgi:hypothetical protein